MNLARPLVILDTETTGVDPVNSRLIELGVVVLFPDGTIKKGQKRFNPGIPIPAEATTVHGISDADVADCPPFSACAAKIHKTLTGRDIAGYNLRSLDLPVLDEELRRCGLKLDLEGVNIIDAFSIYQKKDPRTLEAAVQKYCGRSHEGAHGAAADAAATLDVLKGQLGMYEDLAGMGMEELALFCQRGENQPADLAGKLYFKDGFLYYGFGKNKDCRVKDEPGFGRWMLGKDFSGSTLDCLRSEMDRWGL